MQARLGLPERGDVFRENWRDREFWSWWWQSRWSPRLRSAAALGSAILLGALGVFSADRLMSAKASSPSDVTVWEATVERTVTVPTKGSGRPTATRVRVLTVQIVRHVPTSREVRTRTAVITAKQLVTKPAVVTRTVVDEHTITRARLVTRTITRSVTQVTPPVTVTVPPVTMTETFSAPDSDRDNDHQAWALATAGRKRPTYSPNSPVHSRASAGRPPAQVLGWSIRWPQARPQSRAHVRGFVSVGRSTQPLQKPRRPSTSVKRKVTLPVGSSPGTQEIQAHVGLVGDHVGRVRPRRDPRLRPGASRTFYGEALGLPTVEGEVVEWGDFGIVAVDEEHPLTRNLHVAFGVEDRDAVDAWWNR